jgi:hypothetical protein
VANLQIYTQALVLVDGTILAEEATVSLRRMTRSQEVFTVNKGYAGESPGAATLEIDVTSAVPAADFELDPGKFMKLLKSCEITIVAAGKQLTTKGFIIEDSFKHSVNAESTIDFKFRGQYASWE